MAMYNDRVLHFARRVNFTDSYLHRALPQIQRCVRRFSFMTSAGPYVSAYASCFLRAIKIMQYKPFIFTLRLYWTTQSGRHIKNLHGFRSYYGCSVISLFQISHKPTLSVPSVSVEDEVSHCCLPVVVCHGRNRLCWSQGNVPS